MFPPGRDVVVGMIAAGEIGDSRVNNRSIREAVDTAQVAARCRPVFHRTATQFVVEGTAGVVANTPEPLSPPKSR